MRMASSEIDTIKELIYDKDEISMYNRKDGFSFLLL